MNLDDLARAARAEGLEWDAERAGRVLAGAVVRRDRRAAHRRIAHRSLAALSAAVVVVVVLLRGGAAPASTTPDGTESPAPLALQHDGDGGFGRD